MVLGHLFPVTLWWNSDLDFITRQITTKVLLVCFCVFIRSCQNSNMFQWHKTIFSMCAILEGNLAIHLYQEVKALKCLYGKFLIKSYNPKLLQFWLWLVMLCCVLSCTRLFMLKRWSFAVVNWFLLGEFWNWFGCIHLYCEFKHMKLYSGILYTCLHDASVKCVIAVPVSILPKYILMPWVVTLPWQLR
jgi:hypothetical protein